MVTAQGPPASIAIGTPGYMPTEQGKANPRPNDIYALGIIGIQALTKMSPMQLQTLEDPLRESLSGTWCLSARVGDGTVNDGALPLQRPLPVSKTPSVAASTQWLHPYPASENTTWYHCGIFAASSISGHNVSSPDNTPAAGSRNGQAAGASSPRQWSLVGSGIAAVVAIGVSLAISVLNTGQQARPPFSPPPPGGNSSSTRVTHLQMEEEKNSSCAEAAKCCGVAPKLSQVLRQRGVKQVLRQVCARIEQVASVAPSIE